MRNNRMTFRPWLFISAGLLIALAALAGFYLMNSHESGNILNQKNIRDSGASEEFPVTENPTTTLPVIATIVDSAPANSVGKGSARVQVEPTTELTVPPKAAPILVVGIVKDTQGKVVQSARVIATAKTSKISSGSAYSDTGGLFILTIPVKGRFVVTCSATGYMPESIETTISESSSSQQLEFTLRSATLVRVRFNVERSESDKIRGSQSELDRITKIPGFPILAIATLSEAPRKIHFAVHTTPDRIFGIGQYYPREEIGDLIQQISPIDRDPLSQSFDGILKVDSNLPFYVACVIGTSVVESRLITQAQDTVEFNIPSALLAGQLGTIQARFVDRDTGIPIANVSMIAYASSQRQYYAISNGDGLCSLSGVPTGFYTIVCSAKRSRTERFATIEMSLSVKGGKTTELGTLQLGSGVSIQGRIQVAMGGHYRGTLMIGPFPGDANELRVLGNGKAIQVSPEGNFICDELSPGKYILTSTRGLTVSPGEVPATQHWVVDTSAPESKSLSLTVQNGHEVRIVGDTEYTSPVVGWIVDSTKLPVWSGTLQGALNSFSVTLPDGQYVMYLSDGISPDQSLPFEVSGKPLTLRVE